MEYTEYLERSLFLWKEEEATEQDILDFLNNEETFRTFGEGLEMIIRKKMPEDTKETPREYFTKCVKGKKLKISEGTIKNWFDKSGPKKGAQSREHMYLISFALELNEEETRELFTKVYFDRPFNVRDKKEFIYLYCIRRGLPYGQAEKMLGILQESEKPILEKKAQKEEKNSNEKIEETMLTEAITTVLDELQGEKQVLDFVRNHSRNFQLHNQGIQRVLKVLLEEIHPGERNDKEEWKKLKNRRVDKECSYIVRECAMYEDYSKEETADGRKDFQSRLLYGNKSIASYSSLLDIILGVNLVKEREERAESVFKSARIPQEIRNRFPTKHTFSKWKRWTQEAGGAEISSEELRKLLILLFSYRFWFQIQYEGKENTLEVYMDELDNQLFLANLQPLYHGNPFDWLFLYCTLQTQPLTFFREIMAEVFIGDVE